MKRVINITETLQKEFKRRFIDEHLKPIRASRLELYHYGKNFEYYDYYSENKRLFKYLGVVDEDHHCIYDENEDNFYYVERKHFDPFIISGYINKTVENED